MLICRKHTINPKSTCQRCYFLFVGFLPNQNGLESQWSEKVFKSGTCTKKSRCWGAALVQTHYRHQHRGRGRRLHRPRSAALPAPSGCPLCNAHWTHWKKPHWCDAPVNHCSPGFHSHWKHSHGLAERRERGASSRSPAIRQLEERCGIVYLRAWLSHQ